MRITTTDKKVTIEVDAVERTYPLNHLAYEIRTDNRLVILNRNSTWLFAVQLDKVTVNGTQATPENIDDLLDALFF